MDKDPLVNIDFQPFADVANNLIDKLADGIGWIAMPKGEKKYKKEAEEYLFEQIKIDSKMPLLARASSMCFVKKMIREYSNQNDIVNEAIAQLSDTANPNGIDNEWLATFMDYCKNVESDDIKAIWVKVLAEECNSNGSIPKKLLTILATISKENALAFSDLCLFAINIPIHKNKDFHELSIFWKKYWKKYEKYNVNYGKLLELESMGLINIDIEDGYYISKTNLLFDNKDFKPNYYESVIELHNIGKQFKIGNVVFTDAGRALFSLISVNPKDGVFEVLKKGLKINNDIKD